MPIFPSVAFKGLFSHLPLQFDAASKYPPSSFSFIFHPFLLTAFLRTGGIVVAGTEEHLRHIFGDRLSAWKVGPQELNSFLAS